MNQPDKRGKDVLIAFYEDGTVRAGWDATSDQLRKLRDVIIPALLGQNTLKEDEAEFTSYLFPTGYPQERVDAK